MNFFFVLYSRGFPNTSASAFSQTPQGMEFCTRCDFFFSNITKPPLSHCRRCRQRNWSYPRVQILSLPFSIPECSFLGTKKLSFPIFKNIFWLFNLFLKVKSQLRQGQKIFFWMIYRTVDVMFPSSQPISVGMATTALFSFVEVEWWHSPRHASECSLHLDTYRLSKTWLRIRVLCF